jgi:hypothetical protein
VFSEKKVQWWLARFNSIKMPLLTCNLFIQVEDGLDAKQDQIRDVLKFSGLTQDEHFIKMAMESKRAHKMAMDLLTDTQNDLTTSSTTKKKAKSLRSMNFEELMGRLNEHMRNQGKKQKPQAAGEGVDKE